MAMSTSYSMDDRDSIKFQYEYILNSQSYSSNTSNITINLWVYKDSNTATYGNGTAYCKINGTQFSASIDSDDKFTTTKRKVFSKTLNIPHGVDGKKTLVCQAKFVHSRFNSGYSSSKQLSWTLPTIPRQSTFTCSYSPLTSSSTSQAGTVNISISRESSSFTHKVYYSFGSYSVTIDTNATTSASYKVPLSHMSVIPKSTSGTATIRVDTYYNGDKIGSSVSHSVTITCPSWVVPTVGSLSDTVVASGASTTYGYVQGKSKSTLKINGASGVQGSSISTYSITCSTLGLSSNGSSYTTPTLTKSGSFTFSCYVIDSRGRRSATKTTTITVQNYTEPVISSFSAWRCDSNGAKSESGTCFKFKGVFSGSTSISGNNITANVRVFLRGTTTLIGTYGISNNVESSTYGAGKIDTDKSYEVELTVNDSIGSTITKTVIINSMYSIIDINATGTGIAFGKSSEIDGCLDNGMATIFRTSTYNYGNHYMENNRGLFVKDTSGTYRTMVIIDDSNGMRIASNGCTGALYIGSMNNSDTYLYGRQMLFNTRAVSGEDGTVCRLFRELNTGEGRTIFRPDVTGGAYLGSASFRWNTAFFTNAITTSDRKVKTDIQSIDYAKDFIMSLEPVQYKMKPENGSNGVRTKMGFIAQDVAQVDKTLGKDLSIAQASVINEDGSESPYKGEVIDDEKLSWGLNYNEFIAPLVKVVQDQQKQLEEQQKKIDELKQIVDELRTTNSSGSF